MASVGLQEKANFTRLSRLLVDKGTEALRNTFDSIHAPSNLPAILNANRTSLLRLKPRVINNSQWDLLFPPSGDLPNSKTFDVTLLTVLFRNICGLPSTGWGTMPVNTDRSMKANLVRLKSFRNEIYAHVTSTEVDNATFQSLWQKISEALVELNIPQNDIDDLETCSLGPEEEMYVEILKQWKSQEEDSIKVLEGLSNDVKAMECSVTSSINRLAQITEDKCDEIKQLCQSALPQQSNIEDSQSLINHPLQVSNDTDLHKNYSKESDEDILRKLAKPNFKGKIRRKVKLFHPGTREWLLKKVDQFVENEHESRMLLLTAGPGFGKSVFTAKVCEDFKKKGKLAASHFCDFSNSNLTDPMMMLQSLASQMCENIAGFQEMLLDQLRRPHQVRNLKDAFRIYLQNPLDELELEEPSLVVIDGLDETEVDDKNELVNLIADYFPDLPECIKVLVTSRPGISVAKLSGVKKINIKHSHAKNKLDLQVYLKDCLPSLVLEDDSEDDSDDNSEDDLENNVFKALAMKCEGSFLYAFHVQLELKKRGDLEKMTSDDIIKILPEGLNSIYQRYFERLEDELKDHGHFDVLRILELLVASKGPLPINFITRALGLAPDCRETKKIINKVNETISCLLYVSDDLVTVFHKSVIDWLLTEGYKDHEYTVKVSDGNKSLWLICEQVFEEIKKIVCSGDELNLTNDVKYALKYGLKHLVVCNMKESFFWFADVVIIHTYLTEQDLGHSDVESIINMWVGILQGPAVVDDELRERISWHVIEIEFLKGLIYRSARESLPFYYLQSVLTHSPEGYFSDDEKKIAESVLSKVPRFVEFNVDEVKVMPLAVWGLSQFPGQQVIEAVGLSYDKTMAAVAQINGTIHVISLPRLIELWQYSTEYKRIPCCTFAPDNSFVLFRKLETVLNIAERKEVPFFHGNKETFTSCAFSPNGKKLVTSDGSTTIKLWDVSKQSLLSLLCAEKRVNWCSFSSTGLFVIAYREFCRGMLESDSERSDSDSEDPLIVYGEVMTQGTFCVWNAITWQRSDERNLPDVRSDEGKVIRSKLCHRCFRPGNFKTIMAIEDDLWFHADATKLFVFKTLAPIQEQLSCPSRPTRVYSCSFSPDGSRLATCTSDGCINIWNVDTNHVEQRFKRNQGKSSFACWWSKEFLFVFEFFHSLSKYPMDVNLNILFTQNQQVSLCHLVDEFLFLTAVVEFSEGLLTFKCRMTECVKVLDVSGVREPRMVTLPGIKYGMSITVSSGASFVFGAHTYSFYIWKRNAKQESDVYEVFFTLQSFWLQLKCYFSNDSKVAVVLDRRMFRRNDKIFDLDTGVHRSVKFDTNVGLTNNLFPLSKDRVVIAASNRFLDFFDMDSGAHLGSSFQRYLTKDSLKQLKLSPKETMLAFPKRNGDMEFL